MRASSGCIRPVSASVTRHDDLLRRGQTPARARASSRAARSSIGLPTVSARRQASLARQKGRVHPHAERVEHLGEEGAAGRGRGDVEDLARVEPPGRQRGDVRRLMRDASLAT